MHFAHVNKCDGAKPVARHSIEGYNMQSMRVFSSAIIFAFLSTVFFIFALFYDHLILNLNLVSRIIIVVAVLLLLLVLLVAAI